MSSVIRSQVALFFQHRGFPAVNLADFGSPAGNDGHARLDLTADDRVDAIVSPAMGWPSLERMVNIFRAGQLMNGSVNSIPLRDLDPATVYSRELKVDPVSKAL